MKLCHNFWKLLESCDERLMDSQNFEYYYASAMQCCNFMELCHNFESLLTLLMNVWWILKTLNMIMHWQWHVVTLWDFVITFERFLKVVMNVWWILKTLNMIMRRQCNVATLWNCVITFESLFECVDERLMDSQHFEYAYA